MSVSSTEMQNALTSILANGFDEYMNLVLDEAEEVSIKKKTRKALGRILLKGDNITLMMNAGK
ncbi:putative small nuclear ribonucleoprotein E [Helianthus annuus]|nr:putative small nuclear ribonucleoprotein E [Helianthus annuus]